MSEVTTNAIVSYEDAIIIPSYNILNSLSYYTYTLLNKFNLSFLSSYIHMDNGAKVSDYLFIGSLPTAMSATWLRLNKIDFILNMSGIKYATDVPTISIDFIDANVSIDKIDEYTAKFMLGKDIITKCVGDKKNILVHCAAGIN